MFRLVAVLLVALPAIAAAAPPLHWAADHPRDKLVGDEFLSNPRDPWENYRSRVDAANGLRGTFENCPHDYDVLHYELNFNSFNEATVALDGNTRITFEVQADSLASVDLNLTSQMTVSSVLLDSTTPLSFSHASDILNVQFATLPANGDTILFDVAYSGVPENEGGGGFGGFWWALFPKNAFSMGIGLNAEPPSMADAWFPCYDWPCDKATVELNIEVPQDRIAVANGVLASVDSTGSDHTFHWQHNYPISTYLIAMSVAPYRVLSDTVVTDPRMDVYFHPGYKSKSTVSFQFVDLMMEAFEARFGPYPYDVFKYMTTLKGDMEHQTCVSHALTLVDSTNTYDDILSHEMMHQWYGDCVTYGDWRDIWLSEGFATYGEAVFREHKNGIADYHWYMTNSIMNRVLVSGKTDGLYDPADRWGVINYEKGGSLLHMLRGVLDNDTLFWQVMRDFHANHAYGNAVTADFVADVAATVGQDMSWFLDQWLYGEGHPIYEYGWSYHDIGGGQYRVDVIIRQIQTTSTIFDIPLDFRVQTGSGDFDFSEQIDQAEQTVSFVVSAEPTGLVVDPDDWVLDEQQLAPTSAEFGPEVATAQSLRLETPRPNPARTRTQIRYYVPRAGKVELTIHDVAGRRIRTLSSEQEQPGARAIWWDRRTADGASVAAGVYWVRLAAYDETRTTRVVVVE